MKIKPGTMPFLKFQETLSLKYQIVFLQQIKPSYLTQLVNYLIFLHMVVLLTQNSSIIELKVKIIKLRLKMVLSYCNAVGI